jgi:hypothetical protein
MGNKIKNPKLFFYFQIEEREKNPKLKNISFNFLSNSSTIAIDGYARKVVILILHREYSIHETESLGPQVL